VDSPSPTGTEPPRGRPLLLLGPRVGGVVLATIGTILTATAVGLLPHLAKNGLTVVSVGSVVSLLAGIGLLVAGAWSALRDAGRPGRIAGVVGLVSVVAFATWVIAPAVAATNVADTHIDTTPADLGLPFESVTLTTADGVELAAWYLQGTNGAGVVVRHGAGSTRSDVLDQSAVISGSGYGVLVVDARGHGDSAGTAMDFGWHGDLDIAAGTEFLASRDEIDAGRIGVVGFSMGAEEAIGAAANDPLIRVVVAEGATGRQAADKAWYSDVYGWRGWVQEQAERLQDTVTDLLTDASTPTALRSAVAEASGIRFLLITAGNVADEARAADHIRSGAPERVAVWAVDDAAHTAGYRTSPDEWTRTVISFLDENLT
jgi:uncharacterized protein